MSTVTLTRFTCDRCDLEAEVQEDIGMTRRFLPDGWGHVSLRANDHEGERRMPFNWLVCEGCHSDIRKALRNGK